MYRAWLRAEPGSGREVDIGVVLPAAVEWWECELGEELETAIVSIDRRELAFSQRQSKADRGQVLDEADLERLPGVLAAPKAVLFDSRNQTLIYAFDPAVREGVFGMLAVRVIRRLGRNAVRTSGYFPKEHLRGPRFVPVLGSLED